MNAIRNRWNLPDLGVGIGLRTVHYGHILEKKPKVDWFEIISENFMYTDGRPLQILEQVNDQYPIIMHGVSMSIGSTDPINWDYMKRLKNLAARVKPAWLGDHVCWTGVNGRNGHDLLPIPYNEETLKHLVERIKIVQDYLERPIVLENPSTYMTFKASTMPEQEFIRRMAEESDCALLLDVNNVYVSCRNHHWDPWEYLEGVPYDRVVQIHLAGHTTKERYCLDTHDHPVKDQVWDYYADVMKRAGSRATLLEWDDLIPTFEDVHAEALKAQQYRPALKELKQAGAKKPRREPVPA